MFYIKAFMLMTMQLTSAQTQLQRHIDQAIAQGKLNDAHHLLVSNIKKTPNDHFSYFLLAQVNLAAGDTSKAQKLLEKALSITKHPLYIAHLAKLATLSGQLMSAQHYIDQTLKSELEDATYYDLVANVLTRLGQYETALVWQKKAFTCQPSNPQVTYNLAVGYKVMGEFDKSRDLLQQLITQQPAYFQAHYSLAELNNSHSAKVHLAQLKALVKSKLSAQDSHYAQHAMALNYEHLGEFKNAYNAFIASKKNINQLVKYNADQHSQFCQQITKLSQQFPNTQTDTDFAPIFVVGMPRSGTTLMEKIINQSDQVQGVGELNDIVQLCQGDNKQVLNSNVLANAYKNKHTIEQLNSYQQRVRQLVAPSLRSCDKQPFNFYYIDLILAAFPQAKIICMQRGQQDTCIANFRQLYNPASAFHHYSYDLKNINRYYYDYCDLINHFASTYKDNVLIIQYEELVTEPTSNTQKVYAFCNLEWQTDCLDFYKQQSPSATASKVQVRQPLNRKAINYWRHYDFAVNTL